MYIVALIQLYVKNILIKMVEISPPTTVETRYYTPTLASII